MDSIFDQIEEDAAPISKAYQMKLLLSNEGFEWSKDAIIRLQYLVTELNELRLEFEKKNVDIEKISDEIGDVLFILIDIARLYNVDIENALRMTNAKNEQRYRYVEQKLKAQDKNFKTADLSEIRKFWNEAKTLENK